MSSGDAVVMPSERPRVLRRALGLMRFAREAASASSAAIFIHGADDGSLHGLVSDWDWTRTSFSSELVSWPPVAESLATGEVRRCARALARGPALMPPAQARWIH